jgi:hypothetical protein
MPQNKKPVPSQVPSSSAQLLESLGGLKIGNTVASAFVTFEPPPFHCPTTHLRDF